MGPFLHVDIVAELDVFLAGEFGPVENSDDGLRRELLDAVLSDNL